MKTYKKEITVYDFEGIFDGFCVEVDKSDEITDIYLYHKQCGIKRYMFGLYTKDEKEIRNKLLTFKNKFESAVKDYNLLKYDNALKTFAEIYKKQKQDNVCYIYYNKCQEKLKNRGN